MDKLELEVISALHKRRIEVHPSNEKDHVLLVKKRGPVVLRNKTNLNRLLESLRENEPRWNDEEVVVDGEMRASALGFAEGVAATMLTLKGPQRCERVNSGTGLSHIYPSIERKEFIDGVRASSHQQLFQEPYHGNLITSFALHLPTGVRPMDLMDFETWACPPFDRVYSAARSLLYHATQRSHWKIDGTNFDVHLLKVGDGYDAARMEIFLDLFFGEADESFLCSIPSKDALLFVKSDDERSYRALKAVTERRFLESQTPLTTTIFSLRGGSPQPYTPPTESP